MKKRIVLVVMAALFAVGCYPDSPEYNCHVEIMRDGSERVICDMFLR